MHPSHGGKRIGSFLPPPPPINGAEGHTHTDSPSSSELSSEEEDGEVDNAKSGSMQVEQSQEEDKKSILTRTQANLLNGTTYYLDLKSFEQTLVQKRDFIAASLEQEKFTEDIFDSMRLTGHRMESVIETIRNGTFRNKKTSLIQVLGVPMEDEPEDAPNNTPTPPLPLPVSQPLFRNEGGHDEEHDAEGSHDDHDEEQDAEGSHDDHDEDQDAEGSHDDHEEEQHATPGTNDFHPESSEADNDYEPPPKRRASQRLATATSRTFLASDP